MYIVPKISASAGCGRMTGSTAVGVGSAVSDAVGVGVGDAVADASYSCCHSSLSEWASAVRCAP